MESRESLERIRRRAKEISRPFAARDIISFVMNKIEEKASKEPEPEPEAEQ